MGPLENGKIHAVVMTPASFNITLVNSIYLGGKNLIDKILKKPGKRQYYPISECTMHLNSLFKFLRCFYDEGGNERHCTEFRVTSEKAVFNCAFKRQINCDTTETSYCRHSRLI